MEQGCHVHPAGRKGRWGQAPPNPLHKRAEHRVSAPPPADRPALANCSGDRAAGGRGVGTVGGSCGAGLDASGEVGLSPIPADRAPWEAGSQSRGQSQQVAPRTEAVLHQLPPPGPQARLPPAAKDRSAHNCEDRSAHGSCNLCLHPQSLCERQHPPTHRQRGRKQSGCAPLGTQQKASACPSSEGGWVRMTPWEPGGPPTDPTL